MRGRRFWSGRLRIKLRNTGYPITACAICGVSKHPCLCLYKFQLYWRSQKLDFQEFVSVNLVYPHRDLSIYKFICGPAILRTPWYKSAQPLTNFFFKVSCTVYGSQNTSRIKWFLKRQWLSLAAKLLWRFLLLRLFVQSQMNLSLIHHLCSAERVSLHFVWTGPTFSSDYSTSLCQRIAHKMTSISVGLTRFPDCLMRYSVCYRRFTSRSWTHTGEGALRRSLESVVIMPGSHWSIWCRKH